MGVTIRTEALARPVAPGLSPWPEFAELSPHLPPARGQTVLPPTRRIPTARLEGFEYGCARPADHPRIHQLLVSTMHEPSLGEFSAENDAPRYDPCDRLVVRRGREIAAHVHLLTRNIYFDGIEIPTVDFRQLATLEEYRGRGLASGLLDAAYDEMRRAGIVMATVSTRDPRFFRQRHWVPCGRFSRAVVEPRRILAALVSPPEGSSLSRRASARRRFVKVWRRHELDGLIDLYQRHAPTRFGTVMRWDSDWRWLLARNAFDHIYVVCEGDGGCGEDLLAAALPIVGYAVVRDTQIVELVADQEDETLKRLLLQRVCQDAVETARGLIELHLSPDDGLHRLLREQGARYRFHELDRGHTLMAHVTHLPTFLGLLKPVWKRRLAKGAQPPLMVGLETPTLRIGVTCGARSVSCGAWREATPHRLSLSDGCLVQLALGHHSAGELLADGSLVATTPEARAFAETLFVSVPLWRPAFEDLERA